MKRNVGQAIGETVFDILYLLTVIIAGIILLNGAAFASQRWWFGVMALVLGGGDSFHLIPRMIALWTTGFENHAQSLGIGKAITSITMTGFYVILWTIGLQHYPAILPAFWTSIIYGLALLRIVLCLLPINHWTTDQSSVRWGIIRNVPFVLLGALVMGLFIGGARQTADGFAWLWLAILISFACYIPVVLWAHEKPSLGMLMMPKSCAYAAIILIGLIVLV